MRAGLVERAEEWRWQGELNVLRWASHRPSSAVRRAQPDIEVMLGYRAVKERIEEFIAISFRQLMENNHEIYDGWPRG